jgi:hypothetical protein
MTNTRNSDRSTARAGGQGVGTRRDDPAPHSTLTRVHLGTGTPEVVLLFGTNRINRTWGAFREPVAVPSSLIVLLSVAVPAVALRGPCAPAESHPDHGRVLLAIRPKI